MKCYPCLEKNTNHHRSHSRSIGRGLWQASLDFISSPQGSNTSHHRISGIEVAKGYDNI
ncbi:MAG: hypothetical protein AB7I27_19630 [Bacteriovoracaceae bacterium]